MNHGEEPLKLNLSPAVYKELKSKCARESISVQDFVSDLLTKNITGHSGNKKPKSQENSCEQNILHLFNECPLMKGISQTELTKLADGAQFLRSNKGQIIIREEEIPSSLYIVSSGTLKIYKMSLSGREFDIDLLSRGDTFGESSLISGFNFFAEVRSIEASGIVTISKRDFSAFIYRNPKVIINIATLESIRVNNLAIKLIDMVSYKSNQRVIKMLKALTLKYGNTLSINHKVIAGMCGVTGETATRALIDLKNLGAITLSRGKVQIIDRDKLRY